MKTNTPTSPLLLMFHSHLRAVLPLVLVATAMPLFAVDLDPIVTSGHNKDIVFENDGTPAVNDEIGSRYFFEQGLFGNAAGEEGLPAAPGRTISGFVSGLTGNTINYAFNDYGANNVLMWESADLNATKTLTLSTPAGYSQLAVVLSSGSGTATLSYVIHYDGGGTQAGSIDVADWGSAAAAGTEILGNFDRANTGPVWDNSSTATRWSVYVTEITPTSSASILSIDFTATALSGSSTEAVVFGLAGAAAPPLEVLYITSATANPADVGRTGSTLLSVSVSNGTAPYTVTVDASSVGGPASVSLVDDGTGFTFTNTVAVGGSTAAGGYLLPVSVVDDVSDTTNDSIALTVTGLSLTWNGGGGNADWSTADNWGGTSLLSGDALFFDGSTQLVNDNDTAAETLYAGLTFNAGAGAFVLNGNSITLAANADIVNNAASSVQTVNLGLNFDNNQTFNGGTGGLLLGGGLTNTASGSVTTTLAGSGTLTNLLASTASGTNVLATASDADWTIVDSPGSAPVMVESTLLVGEGGTLTFGSGGSAPSLTMTASDSVGAHRAYVGNASGASTLNVVNGTLTLNTRLNIGTGANASTSAVNVSGGTLTSVGGISLADGNAANVAVVNVSGGVLNSGAAGASSLHVATRGTGTLTVSGTGEVVCNTLDISRNASSTSTTGTVNLDGGTVTAQRVSSGTSATGSGGTPTATFNFNGGTLKASASSATWFQGRLSAPAIPVVSIVKSGGAVIETDGFDVSVLEVLEHDGSLGATADGGLTKNGAGTLTLGAANTYTGNTIVNDGTLHVDGSLASESAVTVNSGGTLAGAGTVGGTVTVEAGGTLAPGASIGTLTLGATPVLDGTTLMEIDSAESPNADKVVVSGNPIAFGGTLTVVNTGAALTGGEVFDLFDASSFTDAFADINLPALDSGLNWWTGNLAVNGTLTVNRAPVAATNSTSVSQGDSVTLTIIGGKHAPSDADGDTLTVTAVSSPTANGGTVSTDGTGVTYTASTTFSGTDTFTYSVSDGKGGSDTAVIAVTVTPASSGLNVTSVSVGGGTATIQALGVPGETYHLQFTESLSPANWQDVSGSDQAASATGQITLTDPDASGLSRFYRTQHVP